MIKVIARTISGDEIVRMVDTAVVGDVCSTVTSMLSNIANSQGEQVDKFTVHEQRIPEHLSFQDPFIANICGKILHFPLRDVHAIGVRSSVLRQVNEFGVFHCVYTSSCNFHTGSTKTCTLFRGGTSRTGVLEAIDHVFVHGGIEEVLVNNVVFSARLGHPVSPHNAKVVHAMRSLQVGSVQECGCTEDTMFVHSLVLQVESTAWLAVYGFADDTNIRVRINMCRTGVLNFFFGIPGGPQLRSARLHRMGIPWRTPAVQHAAAAARSTDSVIGRPCRNARQYPSSRPRHALRRRRRRPSLCKRPAVGHAVATTMCADQLPLGAPALAAHPRPK